MKVGEIVQAFQQVEARSANMHAQKKTQPRSRGSHTPTTMARQGILLQHSSARDNVRSSDNFRVIMQRDLSITSEDKMSGRKYLQAFAGLVFV